MDNPRRWLRILVKAGTSTIDFNDFLRSVCTHLQEYHPEGMIGNHSHVFLWDNLSLHCSPIIHQTVEGKFDHLIVRSVVPDFPPQPNEGKAHPSRVGRRTRHTGSSFHTRGNTKTAGQTLSHSSLIS